MVAFVLKEVYNSYYNIDSIPVEIFLETQRITQHFNENKSLVKQLPAGYTLANRYLIQEVIGIGGMSSVYRARDLHFPNVVKLVAVKEMINDAADPLVRQTIVQNFEREANILVTLNHVSIPKIFDYFTFDDKSYLVEEYIQGKDLEVIINESDTPIDQEQVITWGIELCDVLEYLHNHKPSPIIFRDIKPSNVMVNAHNRIVLVDFGIAKTFRIGQKGTMIGTEGYSPPEQYRGEATPVADIYSLGATLHHCLTKKDPRIEPPFSFDERPIREINPSVSLELTAIINTALKYNPEERFKNAQSMKEALIAIAKKTGMSDRGNNNSSFSSPQSVKPIWSFKCEDEIRGSLNVEKGVLYVGAYDNNLYALNSTDGSFLWKFATEGGLVGKPALDSGLVFIGSEDKKLYAISIRSGKSVWEYSADGPIRSSPKVAEGHLFFGADDGYLHAVNLVSNRLIWRADCGSPVRSSPFVTNENVYVGSELGDFSCFDFRGQAKWRFRSKKGITSSPVVNQGVVYFASLDGFLYALDAKSGWIVWRFRMNKGSISSPEISDNILYVGSADNYIYAIDSSNGKEIWKFKTEHQVSGSPLVSNDSVYCGSVDENMYCLESKTGRLKWKFKTKGPITGTPFVDNNVLYFGSSDKFIYALLA